MWKAVGTNSELMDFITILFKAYTVDTFHFSLFLFKMFGSFSLSVIKDVRVFWPLKHFDASHIVGQCQGNNTIIL